MAVSELTTESASRLERKRAKNREALLAAARRLFVRDGFEHTTIAAIAEEADLGFGTFYRYFPDKESALRALLDEAGREMDAVLLTEDDASILASQALRDLTGRFALAAARNRGVFALWWELGMREGPHSRKVTKGEAPLPVKLHQAVVRILDRGVKSGEFLAGDIALRAHIVTSAHMFLLVPSTQIETDQHVIDALCEFELRALGAPNARDNGQATGRRGQ